MKERNWVCTDPDSCQYRRTAWELDPEGNVFELIQIQVMDHLENGDEVCVIAHDWVYLCDIDDMESVLDCYGYDSIEQFKGEYKEEWKGVLAECQFELDAGCFENISRRVPLMSYEGAKKFIETYVEGNPDKAEDELILNILEQNDVFADVINALLFQGKQKIAPDQLSEADPISRFTIEGEPKNKGEYEIAKHWCPKSDSKNGFDISLFVVRDLADKETYMPARLMGYTGEVYNELLDKTPDGEDLEVPIPTTLTAVLYLGIEKKWDHFKSIKESFGYDYDKRLDPFVGDYFLNLFEIAWLSEEELKRFHSDFKEIAQKLIRKRQECEVNSNS